MPYDYTDAPSTAIPADTVATVVMHIKPGGVGEDGMLTRSKDGGCEMLVFTATVIDGPYKGQNLFERWILEGTTDGHAQLKVKNIKRLKAVLDSALGLDPKDESKEARAARTKSLGQFDGLTFMVKIGVEEGSGAFDDKNVIAKVLTRKDKDWKPVEQAPPFNGGGATAAASQSAPSAAPAAAPVTRPGWAS